jgi:hypothetical protein
MHLFSAPVSATFLAGKTVLIVEPQAPIALFERSVVQEFGAAEVLCCASVKDALAAVRSGIKPDLAIVDFVDEDCLMVLMAELDAAGAALVIASADEAFPTASSAGARISKPFLETELVGAIVAAMKRGQQEA